MQEYRTLSPVDRSDCTRSRLIWICALLALSFLVSTISLAELPSPPSVVHVDVSVADGRSVITELKAVEFAGTGAPLRRAWPLEAPWAGEIELDSATDWTIDVSADGYWSRSESWSGDVRSLSFTLIPTGKVKARVELENDDVPLGPIDIRFGLSTPQRGNKNTRILADMKCPLGMRARGCNLPAGELDLRLEAQGFAPIYLWNVGVEEGRTTDLGLLTFRRGSSVTGWVEGGRGANMEGLVAQIELEPLGLEVSPSREHRSRSELLGHTAKSNQRGFFQMSGLGPGAYMFRATVGGLASAWRQVHIEQPGSETRLQHPLTLFPPAVLEVYLDPPVDPWNQPWSLELRGPERRFSDVIKGPATLAGAWSKAGLEPGTYRLEALDSKRSRWLSEQILGIEGSTDPLYLEIPVVPVRGTIRQGEDGVQAKIIFGTVHGQLSVRMQADEEGRFEGSLPADGEWPLEIALAKESETQALEPVEVRRRPGKRYAEVSLELPDTYIAGKVLRNGQPVDAIVMAMREGAKTKIGVGKYRREVVGPPRRRREFTRRTRADGTFEVSGIAPGKLEIRAYNGSADAAVTLDIEEGLPLPDIILELQRKIVIRGRVVTSHGGVSGARILSQPMSYLVPDTVTGPGGNFEIRLPQDAAFVDLMVLPPGADLFFHHVQLAGEDIEDLVLAASGETGNLVLADTSAANYLYFADVAVPQRLALSWMFEARRIAIPSSSETGLVLRGVSPGVWGLCPGARFQNDLCSTGEVFSGSELILQLPTVQEEEVP